VPKKTKRNQLTIGEYDGFNFMEYKSCYKCYDRSSNNFVSSSTEKFRGLCVWTKESPCKNRGLGRTLDLLCRPPLILVPIRPSHIRNLFKPQIRRCHSPSTWQKRRHPSTALHPFFTQSSPHYSNSTSFQVSTWVRSIAAPYPTHRPAVATQSDSTWSKHPPLI
jgi:hypothetical protein